MVNDELLKIKKFEGVGSSYTQELLIDQKEGDAIVIIFDVDGSTAIPWEVLPDIYFDKNKEHNITYPLLIKTVAEVKQMKNRKPEIGSNYFRKKLTI